MSKLFTFAGTCTEKGATVYKFANDAKRAKALERFGCTDVNMIELPFAMGKEAAVDYLGAQGITAGKMPRVAKAATVTKAPKVAKSKPVAQVAKRVGDKPRKGQTPEAFALEWFASKEALAKAKFG
jgi:hypothetical protein